MIAFRQAAGRPERAVVLSVLTIGIMFWGLLQVDLPLARFIRSVHVVWLERFGDLAGWLGSGPVLVFLSVGLLLAGFFTGRPGLRHAGRHSLIAHGVAALVSQALKHGIGRPRPRLLHADHAFLWHPSLETGFDSFPSGHATASFAIASVIVRHYPRAAWFCYGTAALIAASRVVRGSHFPTDVVVGIGLGMTIGAAVTRPIGEWKRAVPATVVSVTPYLVLAFGLVWIATHLASNGPMLILMTRIGGGLMLCGIILRIAASCCTAWSEDTRGRAMGLAQAVIVVGLALSTGSWLVTGLGLMVSAIQWPAGWRPEGGRPVVVPSPASGSALYRVALTEAPLAIGLVVAILAIQQVRGVIPVL